MTGKPAIDFHLADLAGRPHALTDFRGHWLLLVFHRHLG
jgi:peroxiredoxin